MGIILPITATKIVSTALTANASAIDYSIVEPNFQWEFQQP